MRSHILIFLVGLTQISQTSVTTSPFKRSRKKKVNQILVELQVHYMILCLSLITVCGCPQTLAQLKEEESLLLKERKSLKNVKYSFPSCSNIKSPKSLIYYLFASIRNSQLCRICSSNKEQETSL